jgi:hypothetical protein
MVVIYSKDRVNLTGNPTGGSFSATNGYLPIDFVNAITARWHPAD